MLLDVLASAGAARLTGQRFSASDFPPISEQQAATLIAQLAATDFTRLRMCTMDLLRGIGRIPTLDVRSSQLAAKVTLEDIIGCCEERSRPGFSLRWERLPPLAAYRWDASADNSSILSHPGRNALALYVVASCGPERFQASPTSGDVQPQRKWPFEGTRWWYEPTQPMGYEMWLSIQAGGPPCAHGGYGPSFYPPIAADSGHWWGAHVVQRQRFVALGTPFPIEVWGE